MLSSFPILLKAGDKTNRGVRENEEKNYAKALELYEKSEAYFYQAIKNEAPHDKIKELILETMKMYQDRATILRSYLEKQKVPYGRNSFEVKIDNKRKND